MKNNKEIKSIQGVALPHNMDAERATISAMLLEKNAVYDVIDFLKPEMFYNEFLRSIYEAILRVEATSQIDLITVVEELRKTNDAVDVSELAILSDEVTSAAHIKTHALIVYQDYLRRKLILSCAKTVSESSDLNMDVSDLIDIHLNEIENIANNTVESETEHISEVAVESLEAYKERERRVKEGLSVGIHSGLNKLDRILNGFQPGTLNIIAARPAMGKTAFMLNIARKAAKLGHKVFIVSLEMTKVSLVDRMIIAESGINSNSYKAGRLNPEEYISMMQGRENISLLPIEINDTALMTVQQIKSQAKKLKRKDKCDIILIDYLQLIDSPYIKDRTKNNEIAEITRTLKIMSKELEIPVVLLSQLNREVERRTDKIPMMADLRDSGSIEQDADVILFIHREHYYNDEADPHRGTIRIAKNREGMTGDIDFWVNDTISDFRDDEPRGNTFIPTNKKEDYELPF
jgi:replicative DNA helicase